MTDQHASDCVFPLKNTMTNYALFAQEGWSYHLSAAAPWKCIAVEEPRHERKTFIRCCKEFVKTSLYETRSDLLCRETVIPTSMRTTITLSHSITFDAKVTQCSQQRTPFWKTHPATNPRIRTGPCISGFPIMSVIPKTWFDHLVGPTRCTTNYRSLNRPLVRPLEHCDMKNASRVDKLKKLRLDLRADVLRISGADALPKRCHFCNANQSTCLHLLNLNISWKLQRQRWRDMMWKCQKCEFQVHIWKGSLLESVTIKKLIKIKVTFYVHVWIYHEIVI